MKVYMPLFPRPIGTLPIIYLSKPILPAPRLVEVEPGYFLEDPYEVPDLIEFDSEFEARKYYKEYYPNQYNELEIVI